jgi:hypothetical protein
MSSFGGIVGTLVVAGCFGCQSVGAPGRIPPVAERLFCGAVSRSEDVGGGGEGRCPFRPEPGPSCREGLRTDSRRGVPGDAPPRRRGRVKRGKAGWLDTMRPRAAKRLSTPSVPRNAIAEALPRTPCERKASLRKDSS